MEYVIRVDENDHIIGWAEKMEAHQKAFLHRAFSVFVFNAIGHVLIHRRALTKYHSGGKWTNACCGHPRPNESTQNAAQRRLQEEMGITLALDWVFTFEYKAALDNNLTEHEIDHVFFGEFENQPYPDANEVMDFKWITWDELLTDVGNKPEKYTTWFKICLPKVFDMYRAKHSATS